MLSIRICLFSHALSAVAQAVGQREPGHECAPPLPEAPTQTLARKHRPPFPSPPSRAPALLGRTALRCAAARATGQTKQVRIRGQQRRVRQAAVKTLCDRPERGPAPELLHVPGARQGHCGGRGGGKLSWACGPSSLPAPPQSLGLWARERNGASGTAALHRVGQSRGIFPVPASHPGPPPFERLLPVSHPGHPGPSLLPSNSAKPLGSPARPTGHAHAGDTWQSTQAQQGCWLALESWTSDHTPLSPGVLYSN